jgi:hypothetical protein
MDPQYTNQSAPVENIPSTPTFIADDNRPRPNTKKVGPMIALFVVIIVIVAVAIYLFATKPGSGKPADFLPVARNSQGDNATTLNVPTVANTSDDLQSIANDLEISTAGVDSQTF